MANLLVLYASQEGQTQTIAEFIADVLKDEGHTVSLSAVEEPPLLADFDGVVLGASIHLGNYSKAFRDYTKTHAQHFNELASAFFSVCLTANKKDAQHMEQAQSYIDSLMTEALWQPNLNISFAGALKFTNYGFFKTQVMKAIAKKEHLKVDGNHDFEYTDWERVTRFALDFSKYLKLNTSLTKPSISTVHTNPFA